MRPEDFMMFLVLHSTGIPKEVVTENVLPKGTLPFLGREYMFCSGLVSLSMSAQDCPMGIC